MKTVRRSLFVYTVQQIPKVYVVFYIINNIVLG